MNQNYYLLSILLVWLTTSVQAQNHAPLFASDSILTIKIVTDLKEVMSDVGDDRNSHKAILIYTGANGEADSLKVELKTRGNFRRSPSNCAYPPLRIEFDKKDKADHPLFADQDKLKIVSTCKKKDRHQQYILKEYMVYKMYQLVSPYAFDVRLLHINYVDKNDTTKGFTSYAFFIEDDEQLAERYQIQEITDREVHPEGCDYKLVTNLYLFQFMIGNTDWSISAGHNIKLYNDQGYANAIPVPYDFDWSGLVNTDYAVPQETLGLKNVRERLYMGYCRTDAQWTTFFNWFNVHKTEMLALYENSEFMSTKTKEDCVKYINSFYDVINTPKSVKYQLQVKCN